MSYESNPHATQVSILRHLLFSKEATFAQLQRDSDLTSHHFTFHIKKLVESGYVEKTADGYRLSPAGKEYANRMDTDENEIERQPKVSVVVILERQHNGQREFIAQQRLKQPYYGFWGRLGGKVRWGESFEDAAKRELKEETGLDADFVYKMIFHKRDYKKETGELLEDKIFVIMYADTYDGELIVDYEGGHNEWLTQEAFMAKEKTFESARDFIDLIDQMSPTMRRSIRMMPMNTSVERVDVLICRSDAIYDSIDTVQDGEARYRRLLRIGMNITARSLRSGKSVSDTGLKLLSLPDTASSAPGPIDTLANQYTDIQRATLDRAGSLETDARHAIHVMKLAVPYALEYYPWLDSGKIATYALVHDLVEAYANDVSSLGITPEQKIAKDLAEAQAIETLRKEYGNRWPELVSLVEDYEALKDPEARFNKTFDKLDPGFTHFYSQGHQLKTRYTFTRETFLQAISETTQRMQAYAGEFPLLMSDREELTRRVAELAYPKAA